MSIRDDSGGSDHTWRSTYLNEQTSSIYKKKLVRRGNGIEKIH